MVADGEGKIDAFSVDGQTLNSKDVHAASLPGSAAPNATLEAGPAVMMWHVLPFLVKTAVVCVERASTTADAPLVISRLNVWNVRWQTKGSRGRFPLLLHRVV